MEYNGYMIENDGLFGMTVIRSVGKGALPFALRGSWTSKDRAKNAVDYYLTVNNKDTKNAEAITPTGSK